MGRDAVPARAKIGRDAIDRVDERYGEIVELLGVESGSVRLKNKMELQTAKWGHGDGGELPVPRRYPF